MYSNGVVGSAVHITIDVFSVTSFRNLQFNGCDIILCYVIMVKWVCIIIAIGGFTVTTLYDLRYITFDRQMQYFIKVYYNGPAGPHIISNSMDLNVKRL